MLKIWRWGKCYFHYYPIALWETLLWYLETVLRVLTCIYSQSVVLESNTTFGLSSLIYLWRAVVSSQLSFSYPKYKFPAPVDFPLWAQLSVQQPFLPPVLGCTCLSDVDEKGHSRISLVNVQGHEGSLAVLEIPCLTYFMIVLALFMLCHTRDPQSSFSWIIHPGLSPPL